MSGFFGGRDPYDDPFFSRPFGSTPFGSTISKDLPGADRPNALVIEELDSDDERLLIDENCTGDVGKSNKVPNAQSCAQPVIEHPDDEPDDNDWTANKNKNMDVSLRTDHRLKEPQTRGISFQRVTYGGINGAYYTASTTRKSGSEGVVFEERKQADTTTGEATHQISRGIHDKGHSVTRKLNVGGKVDTMQTLHNLEEDELAGFEQTWKGNADRHLPGWRDGFAGAGESKGGLATWRDWRPIDVQFGRDAGPRNQRDAQAESVGGRSKKVVTIPIE